MSAKIDPTTAESDPAWLSAFDARTDLSAFGPNAIALFALALRFNLEDLVTVAAESITDGGDDKKTDLIYIDKDSGLAVVIQAYFSKSDKPKKAAPSNKAATLSTAMSWVLLTDLNELPDNIRFSASELRQGLLSGEITRLQIWYVHNCPESKNVADEMRNVEQTTNAALKTIGAKEVSVAALEVGRGKFTEWYTETQSPILVNDEFEVLVDEGFLEKGPHWDAYVTSVPLQFLRSQYLKHNVKLFSANVRDYLGSISSDANINNGIKRTAESEPLNFWPYNNGLTILVNSVVPQRLKNQKIRLKISGMSIVNGAQTTGALASLNTAPLKEAKVSVRFIKTDDGEILYNIIRYNNSQNKVAAADFRSTDQIQKRLRKDMDVIPNAQYDGGRRGGPTDAIKRRPNMIPAYTVGQALAAMHGDATVAYNQKSDIWSNDSLYTRYFNDQTTAAHIVFAYSLLRSVEDRKNKLLVKSRQEPEEMTESEETQLAFFRRRGSTFLFVTAMASCLEIILGKKIPNRFRLSFGTKTAPAKAKQHWDELVEAHLPFSTHLEDAFTYGLQNQERLKKAVATFTSLVEVTAKSNRPLYQKFAKAVFTK